MPSDDQLDTIAGAISDGTLDPKTLPDDKRLRLKSALIDLHSRRSGAPTTPSLPADQQVPGMFPYDEEKKIWDQANKQGLDYYQAKDLVTKARNQYTQTRPEGGLVDNIKGASAVVANTAMAPIGLAKQGIEAAGQGIQNLAPGSISAKVAGGAVKMAGAAIPSSPLQVAGNEVAGAAIKGAMPYVNKAASALGKGLEGLSGLEYKTPGVLKDAANDSSILFGPGKKEAGAAYEAIKDELQVRPAMLTASSNTSLIELAKYALENGDLSPQEALIARQAVDKAWDTLPKSTANYLRPKFDAIAKTITADADAGFQRAIKSEALQKILATNKGGGTSIAKLFLGGLTGGALNFVSSPVVQGATATAAGVAGRIAEEAPRQLLGAAALRALQSSRNRP